VASAIDSKINVIISIGIILGALLSEFGKSQRIPLLYYCDPIIAIIVSFFIFRELIEIFVAFIKGKEDKIQFEKFQMPYEANFKEYVIKWILMTYIDDPKSTFTSKDLEEMF
jgi:phosphate/sulfate permease